MPMVESGAHCKGVSFWFYLKTHFKPLHIFELWQVPVSTVPVSNSKHATSFNQGNKLQTTRNSQSAGFTEPLKVEKVKRSATKPTDLQRKWKQIEQQLERAAASFMEPEKLNSQTTENIPLEMGSDKKMVAPVTIFLDYFYFLHALTSCYMRLPYVVYFYFGHALTMFWTCLNHMFIHAYTTWYIHIYSRFLASCFFS